MLPFHAFVLVVLVLYYFYGKKTEVAKLSISGTWSCEMFGER